MKNLPVRTVWQPCRFSPPQSYEFIFILALPKRSNGTHGIFSSILHARYLFLLYLSRCKPTHYNSISDVKSHDISSCMIFDGHIIDNVLGMPIEYISSCGENSTTQLRR
jgi:hypothetical protein